MPAPSEDLATQGGGVCGWRGCHRGKTSPRADANGSRRQAPGRKLCLWRRRENAAGNEWIRGGRAPESMEERWDGKKWDRNGKTMGMTTPSKKNTQYKNMTEFITK